MGKGQRIRNEHKAQAGVNLKTSSSDGKKTLTIADPTASNRAIRQHIREVGSFMLFGGCPICGEFACGVMSAEGDHDARYHTMCVALHSVDQHIHDYEHADLNKYVLPVSEDTDVEDTARLIGAIMEAVA